MSKESPGIAWYALIWVSGILLLGGCAKPVGARSFLANPAVQDLLEEGEGVAVKIEFENPEGIDLEIQTNQGKGENGPVTVYKNGSPGLVIISVSNYADFDKNSIAWYITRDTGTVRIPTQGIYYTYLVEAGVKPFADGGLYQLTVVMTRDEVPYSAYIYIRVVV
jgi:hypothetical protein